MLDVDPDDTAPDPRVVRRALVSLALSGAAVALPVAGAVGAIVLATRSFQVEIVYAWLAFAFGGSFASVVGASQVAGPIVQHRYGHVAERLSAAAGILVLMIALGVLWSLRVLVGR